MDGHQRIISSTGTRARADGSLWGAVRPSGEGGRDGRGCGFRLGVWGRVVVTVVETLVVEGMLRGWDGGCPWQKLFLGDRRRG